MYFKAGSRRPTIAETVAYYRERKIGLVMFTVDSEHQIGARRIPNEEVADAARENADMMIAFASIDPHKGKMGVREAKALLKDGVIRGFKFHPTAQGFFPNDRMAYPLYEVIAEHKLPAIFHSGHSGIGTGHAGRRRAAAEIFQPDLPRRRGGGLSRYECHHRAPVLAVAGRGAVGVLAQAECLYRSVGLVAEILSAATDPVRQQSAEAQDAVRLGLPADHAGSLDEGLRRMAGFKPEVRPLILKENAIEALRLRVQS